MTLAKEVFQRELAAMVASPAWADLREWFAQHQVRRVVITGTGYEDEAKRAGANYAGAVAFMLAIENEVERSKNEQRDAERRRQAAIPSRGSAERRSRNPAGAGRAAPGEAQTG